jgi:hypothetical protein
MLRHHIYDYCSVLSHASLLSSTSRDKLNQLGFSWELPTHTRRRKKGDEVVEGEEAVTDSVVSVAKSKEEKKTDLEVLAEILPAVTSGGGSSKWPHEVSSSKLIVFPYDLY